MNFDKYKDTIQIALTIILLFVIFGNINAIQSALGSLKKVEDVEKQLDQTRQKTAELSDAIEEVKTDEYLEKEALERYKLVKEPSTILVVESAKTIDEIKAMEQNAAIITRPKTNFEQWKEYFKF